MPLVPPEGSFWENASICTFGPAMAIWMLPPAEYADSLLDPEVLKREGLAVFRVDAQDVPARREQTKREL